MLASMPLSQTRYPQPLHVANDCGLCSLVAVMSAALFSYLSAPYSFGRTPFGSYCHLGFVNLHSTQGVQLHEAAVRLLMIKTFLSACL